MPPTAPMQAKWGEGNLAQAGDLMAGAELTASSSDEMQILKYLQEVRKALLLAVASMNFIFPQYGSATNDSTVSSKIVGGGYRIQLSI